MPKPCSFDEGQISGARHLYENGATQKIIAAHLDISVNTLRKYLQIWNWRRRAATGRNNMGAPADTDVAKTGEKSNGGDCGSGTRALASRVETAVRRELI